MSRKKEYSLGAELGRARRKQIKRDGHVRDSSREAKAASQLLDPEHTVLLAKIMALETLLDMLWTDRFSRESNPVEEAKEFKSWVLSTIDYDPYGPLENTAYEMVEQRLDSILIRVGSL